MNPFGKREVKATADFARIRDLPKRVVQDPQTLALEMTQALKTPHGTQTLRPIQAQALYELMATGGLFAPMGVGTGKTLVFLLAPTVLGAKRTLGIVPASLVEKTSRDREEYGEHWHVDSAMQFMSYEALGRVNQSEFLTNYGADVLVMDEAHRAKNAKAACTRRIARYIQEHNPKVVNMSGTMMAKSLRDFAALLRWALGAENAPIPMTYGELEEWADALDERVNPMQRVKPGALKSLAPHVQGTDIEKARKGFHERLVSTPGVVCSLHEEQPNCSLQIKGHVYDVNEVTDENFKRLREMWETPDGWALSEAVDVWRHSRELAIGFHYVWDPRPPDEWLSARREWAKFVRDTLSAVKHLDSEKQVALACEAGDLPRAEFDAWQEIKDTFIVNQKAIWHDDTVLEYCAKWLKNNKGIVWVEHTFFGRELSKRTGCPYFGQSGLDADGNSLVDLAKQGKAVPIIASIAANGTGKNLQAWNKGLITSCPTGQHIIEQLLGRNHRPGQEADEVSFEILVGCIEHAEAWARAEAEAQMAGDIFGSTQKVLLADVDMPDAEEARKWPGYRWMKTSGMKE